MEAKDRILLIARRVRVQGQFPIPASHFAANGGQLVECDFQVDNKSRAYYEEKIRDHDEQEDPGIAEETDDDPGDQDYKEGAELQGGIHEGLCCKLVCDDNKWPPQWS